MAQPLARDLVRHASDELFDERARGVALSVQVRRREAARLGEAPRVTGPWPEAAPEDVCMPSAEERDRLPRQLDDEAA